MWEWPWQTAGMAIPCSWEKLKQVLEKGHSCNMLLNTCPKSFPLCFSHSALGSKVLVPHLMGGEALLRFALLLNNLSMADIAERVRREKKQDFGWGFNWGRGRAGDLAVAGDDYPLCGLEHCLYAELVEVTSQGNSLKTNTYVLLTPCCCTSLSGWASRRQQTKNNITKGNCVSGEVISVICPMQWIPLSYGLCWRSC